MATDRTEANRAMLAEAADTQEKSKEAIRRIKKQAVETEALAGLTLNELQTQGKQMDDINAELDHVAVQLDKTQALQNQFDRWAGNFFGGKKNAALREASKEQIKNNARDDDDPTSKIREVFEVEKFDTISRIWRPVDIFLCSNPAVAAKQVFNPKNMKDDNVMWKIDHSHTGVDVEGWTYGYDNNTLIKSGGGDGTKKWNHYARRRKWVLEDTKVASTAATVSAVKERQVQRGVISSSASSSARGKKVEYVPRGKGNLVASGLTSGGMMGSGGGVGGDQRLDEESQLGMNKLKENDDEMDDELDAISEIVGRMGVIAGDMNEETRRQNAKIESIDMRMETGREKNAIVNARLKSHVKHS